MTVRQRKPTTGIQTNAEGFEIPQPNRRSGTADRFTFILMGILQLIAVAIIFKQLKALGFLPDYIDTDFSRVRLPVSLLCIPHRPHCLSIYVLHAPCPR